MHHFLRERLKIVISAGIALVVIALACVVVNDGTFHPAPSLFQDGADADVVRPQDRGRAAEGSDAEGTAEDGAQAASQVSAGDELPSDSHGPYEPAVALVGVREGLTTEEATSALAHADGVIAHEVTDAELALGVIKVELEEGVSIDDATEALSGATDVVEAVQPNYVYYLAETGTPADLAERVQEVGNIATAEESATGEPAQGEASASGGMSLADAVVSDPYAAGDTQWALSSIKAYQAWAVAKGQDLKTDEADDRVTVAVFDNFFDVGHADLADNVVGATDVSGAGSTPPVAGNAKHGTHVAGIVSATADNGVGVAGVSYNARIMPVRVFKADGSTDSLTLLSAYEYLDKLKESGTDYNVRVVNMSLGAAVLTPRVATAPTDKDRYDALLLQRVKKAKDDGIVTVGAAGNTDAIKGVDLTVYENPTIPFDFFPGDDSSVVSVINLCKNADGSVARNDTSNYNLSSERDKNISAPGTNIWSTVPGGAYETMNGTSMAAPVVSAVLALEMTAYELRARELKSSETLSVDKAVELLYRSAQRGEALAEVTDSVTSKGWYKADYDSSFHPDYGYGEVNAYAAVLAARAQAEEDVALADLRARAEKVDAAILLLPWEFTVTTAQRESVESVYEEYVSLGEAGQKLVGRAEMLLQVHGRLMELVDAEGRVDALPAADKVTLDNLDEAASSLKVVSDACVDLRSQMSQASLERLAALEARCELLRGVRGTDWYALMGGQFPATVSLDDRQVVEAARTAYNKMSDAQKEAVLTSSLYQALSDAELRIVELLIDRLPGAAETSGWKMADWREIDQDIAEANTAYAGLYDADEAKNRQPLVSNAAALADVLARRTAQQEAEDQEQRERERESEQRWNTANTLVNGLRDVPSALEGLVTKYGRQRDLADASELADAAACTAYLTAYHEMLQDVVEDAGFKGLQDQVAKAHDAYQALSDAQREMLEHADYLPAAELALARKQPAVAKLVAGIAILGKRTVSYAYEKLVTALCADFDALEEAGLSGSVSAAEHEQLLAASSAITACWDEAMRIAGIVDALPQPAGVTWDNRSVVAAARSAYDTLDAAQREAVGPERPERLAAAEAEVVRLQAVIDLVSGLPAEVGLKDRGAVEAARTAFDALSEAQRASLGTYELRLSSAEVTLARLQAQSDEEVTEEIVMTMQSSIGTLSSQGEIDLAGLDEDSLASYREFADNMEETYRGLGATPRGRIIMSAVNTLKARIGELEKAREQAAVEEGRAAGQDASEVVTVVEAAETDEDVAFAQGATDDGEEPSSQVDASAPADLAMQAADDDAPARQRVAQAQRLIAALPVVYSVTLGDQTAIAVARAAYDALTVEERAQVTNTPRLVTAEARCVQLVEHLIGCLPDPEEVVEGDADAIVAARAAYDALPDAQRAELSNAARLLAVEARHAEIVDRAEAPALSYRVSGDAEGWQEWVDGGAEAVVAGGTLPVFGLDAQLGARTVSGTLQYRVYAGGDSWLPWSAEGAGVAGPQAVQALQLRLTGELDALYDLWYRSRVELAGWMGWTASGAPSGTHGLGLNLEAVEILLVKKGAPAPGPTADSYR